MRIMFQGEYQPSRGVNLKELRKLYHAAPAKSPIPGHAEASPNQIAVYVSRQYDNADKPKMDCLDQLEEISDSTGVGNLELLAFVFTGDRLQNSDFLEEFTMAVEEVKYRYGPEAQAWLRPDDFTDNGRIDWAEFDQRLQEVNFHPQ